MQPLAITALISGVVMVFGVTVTLILTRHDIKRRRVPITINRWILHGSIPLAAAGLALGLISKGSGQTPATHNIVYAVATTLLLAALLLALVGAANAHSGHQRRSSHAWRL